MTPELKICPFCGGEAFVAVTLDKTFRPMCRQDGCCALDAYTTAAAACVAWNARADNARIIQLEAENVDLREAGKRSMDNHHQSKAEAKRWFDKAQEWREALERIATVDMGGGFMGARACRAVARTALKGAAHD